MENKPNHLVRQLASLKVVSRLLAHELHAQGSAKTVSISRDQLQEIQTTLDLFIEEAGRRLSASASTSTAASLPTAGETHLVPTRN